MKIKVNTGKRETKIVGEKDGILLIDVKGKAENNEANKEIIRFFSKKYGRKVKMVKGLRSRRKVIRFL